MALRYVTVDVFTDRPFGGNPLAVVFGAERLDTARMQAVAREFNYSETTFVLPPRDPSHHAHVRIFTPGQELPFAGHPNVGTGFVLALERMRRGETVPETFWFEETAGLVPVRPIHSDEALVGAELTAPERLTRLRSFEAAPVARAIGLAPDAVMVDRHPPHIASAGLPFLLVELSSPSLVDRAVADRAGLAALLPCDGADGVYLYARDGRGGLYARMFAPSDGIDEDPATGSAAAALGALLGALSGGDLSLTIRQGVAMGRPSLLSVSVVDGAVSVGGRCIPMMTGQLAFG